LEISRLELRTKIVKRDFGLIAKAKMLIGGNNPPGSVAPPHRMPHPCPTWGNVEDFIFKLNRHPLYNQHIETAKNNVELSAFKLKQTF
jgi:hypothetical protein